MAKIIWKPSKTQAEHSQMMQFIHKVNKSYGLSLTHYPSLYQWSIEDKASFWQSVWDFCRIKASKEADVIFSPGKTMRDSKWFAGATLNFAENLLSRRDDTLALIFNNERNQRRVYTFLQMYEAVSKIAAYFKHIGLQKNDKVAAVLPNMPETILSMLATTSLGAIWSSCSPDFGCEGLYDRFHQVQPKVLIICDGYFYNGKHFSLEDKITWLQEKIPSIEHIIIVNNTDQNIAQRSIDFDEILQWPSSAITFEPLPFNHPLYIMFSSGTTGIPKCIVHGAGGTLLQHLKELVLHTDLKINDRIFYYTTCGWMMWNWYISSLATGATVVQYDGAPFYPNPSVLIDFLEKENITIFGTSAKYISAIEKSDVKPIQSHKLNSLRTILSTGSPLVQKNYEYVYTHFKNDVCLSSISGGTDIISCFALGNPLLPVYTGELQCVGLGMSVKVFNEEGQAVINEKGELVCTSPFPSMPIYFLNDPQQEKYKKAYFDRYPNIWCHGDYATLTDHQTLIIYGRSDTTLNSGGVRIGTAEIYRQIEQIPEILDSVAVSQEWEDDSRIILFIVLKKGYALSDDLTTKIKQTLKTHCSPRHVPAKIIAIPDIPKTMSGKTVELAVREIIHQRVVKNISAIANPESLEYFKHLSALQDP